MHKMYIVVQSLLKRRLPVLSWLPKYTWPDAGSDFVAGITVGLTLIPQSIAYAALAELPPQYGLYSAFAGALVYIFFGTCKEVNIGPTALASLLTALYTGGSGNNADFAVLLAFLSGIVTVLLAIFGLGNLVDLVSMPVVSGFTSAAAIIIASSQIAGLLGIKIHSHSFIEAWRELIPKIGNPWKRDALLGVACCIVLLSLRQIKELAIVKSAGKSQGHRKFLGNFLWFLSTARNALVVIFCTALAYFLYDPDSQPFILTGDVRPGLPKFAPPPFSTVDGENTLNFWMMISNLGSGIFVVSIICILGNVAIGKAFAQGKPLDATQEILAVGLCNLVGSFFNSMPVTGSFSRSAVNNASGVRTPLGGLYTGILVILALSLLTPCFFFIPRATLASVIVCAVLFMVEYQVVIPLWKKNKVDLVILFVTFFACLGLGVVRGILIGVVLDIAKLIYYQSRPNVKIIYDQRQTCLWVKFGNDSLLFPSAENLRANITKELNHNIGCQFLVFDCGSLVRIDSTATGTLADLGKSNPTITFILFDLQEKIFQAIKEEFPAAMHFMDSDKLKDYLQENNKGTSIDTARIPIEAIDAASTKL